MECKEGMRGCFVGLGFLWWIMLLASPSAIATEYIVGNVTGWTNSGFNYTQWAASNVFFVGDTLLFNYVPADHTVVEVNGTSFETCSLGNPLVTHTDGNTVVQLSNARSYYYVCGVGLHCLEGQKLEVQVNSQLGNPLPGPSPSQQHSGSQVSSRPNSALYIAIAVAAFFFRP